MKPTSIRLSDLDLQRIDEIKEYYSECWGISKEEISTTDIISWSIGIAHLVKVQYNLDLSKYPTKGLKKHNDR